MKLLCIALLLTLFTFLQTKPVFAQLPPTPIPNISQTPAVVETKSPKDDANATISTIKKFVTSTDTLLGGFIFYTPDVFAQSIELKDGTVLPGLGSYRDIFYTISIPFIALAIAYFAIRRLQDDTPFAYKALLTKLFFVAILFIITPTMLSYSIQANNLLVQKITSEQNFSQFVTDFFDNQQEQIQKGADPKDFGIPSTQPTLGQSFWNSLLEIVLFLIALFFFLIGFLFIAFQFIIRFASLLFLSVLFPIAIPFMLSEKTEGITNMYFKTWFTFLIHQPAFALGYMLASSFLSTILATNGASLGMLFFYSGFLFFLGGVNTLVASIFGSSWTAIGSNVGAGILAAPFSKSTNEFKRGVMGKNATSISNFAGQQLRNQVGRGFTRLKSKFAQNTNSDSSSDQPANQHRYSKNQRSVPRQKLEDLIQRESYPVPKVPVDNDSQSKGISNQNGMVHLKGDGYSAIDKKTGLKTTYLTKSDAQADGHQPSQLHPTKIDGKYIELAGYDKKSRSSSKVKELLRTDKRAMQKQGIKGVLVKKPGKQAKDIITRIYSQEPL